MNENYINIKINTKLFKNFLTCKSNLQINLIKILIKHGK